MDVTLEQVYREALRLSDESKACLAEKLVEYLEANMSPQLQREHMEIVNKRRQQILSGRVTPIDGSEALGRARRMRRQ